MIAGQGTIGLELAEQVPDLGTVLIPVGGGGLAAGIAIALRALRPDVRLVGVEVDRDAHTIADGIAVKQPGELTMEHPRPAARRARRRRRRRDQRRDHAAARALEAARRGRRRGRRRGAPRRARPAAPGPVCAVVSGGNIDPTTLISVLRHGMTVEGRYLAMRTRLVDRPGELIRVCQLIAARARQHRPDRAPPRGRPARRRRRRPRPDRRHAQRGALPAADRGARGERLPRGAAPLMQPKRVLRGAPREGRPRAARRCRARATSSTSPARAAGSSRCTTGRLTVTENAEGDGDVVFSMSAETFDRILARQAEPDDRLHDRQGEGHAVTSRPRWTSRRSSSAARPSSAMMRWLDGERRRAT